MLWVMDPAVFAGNSWNPPQGRITGTYRRGNVQCQGVSSEDGVASSNGNSGQSNAGARGMREDSDPSTLPRHRTKRRTTRKDTVLSQMSRVFRKGEEWISSCLQDRFPDPSGYPRLQTEPWP